jgi:hypothetical protein
MESHSQSSSPTQKPTKKESKFVKLQKQVDSSIREKWAEEQSMLKEQLIEEDKFDW